MRRIRGYMPGLVLALPFMAMAAHVAPLRLDIARAAVVEDAPGGPARLDVELASPSRDAFAQFTAAHVGKRVSFVANGKALTTVTVQEPITTGKLSISPGQGRYGLSDAELKKLADRLGSGKTTIEVIDAPAK